MTIDKRPKSQYLLILLLVSICIPFNVQSAKEHRPIANAGDNQFAKINTTVKLNASNSTDIDGDKLHYQWEIISKPQKSH